MIKNTEQFLKLIKKFMKKKWGLKWKMPKYRNGVTALTNNDCNV